MSAARMLGYIAKVVALALKRSEGVKGVNGALRRQGTNRKAAARYMGYI